MSDRFTTLRSKELIFRKIIQVWYNLSLFLSCSNIRRKNSLNVLIKLFLLKKQCIWRFWRFCQLRNNANLMLCTEIKHIHFIILLVDLCKLVCVSSRTDCSIIFYGEIFSWIIVFLSWKECWTIGNTSFFYKQNSASVLLSFFMNWASWKASSYWDIFHICYICVLV